MTDRGPYFELDCQTLIFIEKYILLFQLFATVVTLK